MIVYGQLSCICLRANEGRESKTKDSVYNAHLNFRSFFSGKKSAHYTRVNMVRRFDKYERNKCIDISQKASKAHE